VSTRALLVGAAAVVLAPTTVVLGIGIIAGGAGVGSSAAAVAAATAVCTYAYPDADRLADTMSALTDEPVQAPQWDRYANLIGVDPGQFRWEDSTDEQRDELLHTAITNLLKTTNPAAITTPPLIWWHGTVPEDTDNTWETTPVPGWNGTLGDYLAALIDGYATSRYAPAVTPSGELDPGIHWGEQTVTREQIAQIAFEAGFRGEALVAMVGIAWRESGGHPQLYVNRPSTGDWSYGLWGLNVGKDMQFWPQFQSWGINSPDELRTPLGNAGAAFAMYQQMGERPWGPYKGKPWTYSTDQAAARAAVDNAARKGLLGQPWPDSTTPANNTTAGSATGQDHNDHTWVNHQCVPPASTTCRQPAQLAAILATIRHLESGDDYTHNSHAVSADGPNGGGNPTGAYQFLNISWGGYGGYAEAFMAPPSVQDERAVDNVTRILEAFDGDPSWVPIAWYVGMGGARNVQDGTWTTAYVPNPAYNRISIGDYQARWLDHYTTIALPAAGGTTIACPHGGQAAVAWAETQIGAPYAAASRYRFGNPPWPGGTIIGDRGDRYSFPAGTIVYDCSGFVIAAWRKAGVDLVAQYGLYGSQAFPHSPLEEIDPSAVIPGDLAVYSVSASGVGHIVMVHHVDPDGTVHIIEATPSRGVHIGVINWARVISVKRPPSPT
jgi:Lysozyme like domain